MEDEQNRHSAGFQRDHARLVDRASPGSWNDNIRKDIESSGVTWEEALPLMTDRNEWSQLLDIVSNMKILSELICMLLP